MNRRNFILAALFAPTALLAKKDERVLKLTYSVTKKGECFPDQDKWEVVCGQKVNRGPLWDGKINMSFYHHGVIEK